MFHVKHHFYPVEKRQRIDQIRETAAFRLMDSGRGERIGVIAFKIRAPKSVAA